jgi:cytochrome bd-type quinol oxidase subunit 2
MVAGTSLGQLTYASFYLSSLTFGYLSFPDNNPLVSYPPTINHPVQFLQSIHLFWFLTAFTFLGAMQVHGAAYALYGPNGPSERPKHNTVQIRHSLAFALGAAPGKIPVVPCRLATSNIGQELLKDLLQDRNRVGRGFRGIGDIGLMMTWGRFLRFLYFVPMGLHRTLSRAALIALAASLWIAGGKYVGFVLLAALFVLHFRSIVWAPFPRVMNSDALDDRFTPEYLVNQPVEKPEDEVRPRIETE